MAIPAAGAVLRRGALDGAVIVGQFGDTDPRPAAAVGATEERTTLPDLADCAPPLRLRVTGADPRDRDGGESLALQDSSGRHAFAGTQEKLECSYMVVMEDGVDAASGKPIYRMLPVSHWFSFRRLPPAHVKELTKEEQQEMYEALQKYGSRPNRATLALARLAEAQSGHGRLASEGGAADEFGGLESIDGTEFTDSAVGRRKRGGGGGGGGAGSRGGVLAGLGGGGDLDDMYAAVEGGGREGGGDGEGGAGGDEFEGVGVRESTRGGYADDGVQEFVIEVVGNEGAGAEEGLDAELDYFDDDAGDDGKHEGWEDHLGLGTEKTTAEEEAGAAVFGEEEDEDEDEEEEEDEEGKEGKDGEGEEKRDREKPVGGSGAGTKQRLSARTGEEAPLPGAKRGRFTTDPVALTSMREELISFLRAKGGQATLKAIAESFARYVGKDADVKRRFIELIRQITQVRIVDGVSHQVLRPGVGKK